MDEKEADKQEEEFDPYIYIAPLPYLGVAFLPLSIKLILDILIYGVNIFSHITDIVIMIGLFETNLYIPIIFKKIKSKIKEKQVDKKRAHEVMSLAIQAILFIDLPYFFVLLYTAFKYFIRLHNMTAYLIFAGLFMLLFGIFILSVEMNIDEFEKAKALETNKKQDG
jgi:hypothetical protein